MICYHFVDSFFKMATFVLNQIMFYGVMCFALLYTCFFVPSCSAGIRRGWGPRNNRRWHGSIPARVAPTGMQL